MSAPPGWTGKIPALGDFATRRLPREFVDPWHDWLAEELALARDALGEAWQETWRHAPIWRFALAENVIGASAWLGLWIPSQDRVGRLYPLAIAWLRTSSRSWESSEAAAKFALSPNGTVAAFESALAATAESSTPPPPVAPELSKWWQAGATLTTAGLPRGADFLSLLQQQAPLARASGRGAGGEGPTK